MLPQPCYACLGTYPSTIKNKHLWYPGTQTEYATSVTNPWRLEIAVCLRRRLYARRVPGYIPEHKKNNCMWYTGTQAAYAAFFTNA